METAICGQYSDYNDSQVENELEEYVGKFPEVDMHERATFKVVYPCEVKGGWEAKQGNEDQVSQREKETKKIGVEVEGFPESFPVHEDKNGEVAVYNDGDQGEDEKEGSYHLQFRHCEFVFRQSWVGFVRQCSWMVNYRHGCSACTSYIVQHIRCVPC